jgi:SAM-dependent methyltransferase
MDEWFRDWFDEDYSALYAHRDEEEAARAVAIALQAAPALASGPVLDLGCGNGRHLAELRRINPKAFGLDLSQHLLGLASPALRGSLIRGDMRHLPLRKESLSGVCLWFTPFGYFSDAQNRGLLCSLRRLLKPGGVLLLDFLNAHQIRRSLVEEDLVEGPELRVESRRSIEGNRLVKRMRIERLETGAVREVTESVQLYRPGELCRMAGECGLSLFQERGGYDGAAFDREASPRWIGFFRKD